MRLQNSEPTRCSSRKLSKTKEPPGRAKRSANTGPRAASASTPESPAQHDDLVGWHGADELVLAAAEDAAHAPAEIVAVEDQTAVFPQRQRAPEEAFAVVTVLEREAPGHRGPVCQMVTRRSARSINCATSGGVTHRPPSSARSSSVAPRATAQPFQT